nr:MarR family transcriptional regulator [Micromonospora sp. DSM 115978]
MASTLAASAENPTQARILRHLRDGGPLSRVELAELIGTSRTTVAAEVTRLADLGLVDDVGPGASRGGRRATLVDLAAQL